MAWFEDDAFWRDLYPYMFPPERFGAAPKQVEQIISLTGVHGGRVLDVCCGPGRHSIEFARRGFEVTGVDRSPFLLDRARGRAAEAGVSCNWIQGDMRRFRTDGGFGLACNMFTSFGYFESEVDNFKALRNVREQMLAGGSFVMEMLGKERLARIWQSSLFAEYGDGASLLQRPVIRDDWTRLHNEWTLMKDGLYRTYEFEHSIYSGRELRELLLDAGFEKVQLYGDIEGAPYDLEATRLIAVATNRTGSSELET